jgi:hypothetical protein
MYFCQIYALDCTCGGGRTVVSVGCTIQPIDLLAQTKLDGACTDPLIYCSHDAGT